MFKWENILYMKIYISFENNWSGTPLTIKVANKIMVENMKQKTKKKQVSQQI